MLAYPRNEPNPVYAIFALETKCNRSPPPPQSTKETLIAKRLTLRLEDPNRRIDLLLGLCLLLFDWNMEYPNSDKSDDDSNKYDDGDHKHYKRFFDHRDGGTSWSQHFRSSIQLSVQLRKSS